MKTRMIILLCLALISSITRASDPIPHGMWEVTQVIVDKSVDGKTDKKAHNKASDVKSYIRFPQNWEVKDSKTIVLHYQDGTEEIATFALEGNRLQVDISVAMLAYQYKLSDNTLTLNITHNYLNNLRSGKTEKIEEKWTIVLRKNDKIDNETP